MCDPYDVGHPCRACRSACSISQSASLTTGRYMQSSAKGLTELETSPARSFIYTKKSNGQRTVPCGTPDRTGAVSDVVPSTHCVRPMRKEAIHLCRFPVTP